MAYSAIQPRRQSSRRHTDKKQSLNAHPETRIYARIAFKCWPDLLNANDFLCKQSDLDITYTQYG